MRILPSVLTAATLLLSGCTVYHPTYSAISSKNINLTDLHVDRSQLKGIARAEECQHIFFLIPTAPISISGVVDKALDAKGANLLLKARIQNHGFYLPLIYGRNCIEVDGWAYDTDH